MSRPSRDAFWYGLAAQYATRATCPRAAIGAVSPLSLMGTTAPVVLRHVAIETEHLNLEAMLALPKIAPVPVEILREHIPMLLPVLVDVIDGQEGRLGLPATDAPASQHLGHLGLESMLVRPSLFGNSIRVRVRPDRLIVAISAALLGGIAKRGLMLSAIRAVGESVLGRLSLASATHAGCSRFLVVASLARLRCRLLSRLPIERPTGDPFAVVRAAWLAGSTALGDGFMTSAAGLR